MCLEMFQGNSDLCDSEFATAYACRVVLPTIFTCVADTFVLPVANKAQLYHVYM